MQILCQLPKWTVMFLCRHQLQKYALKRLSVNESWKDAEIIYSFTAQCNPIRNIICLRESKKKKKKWSKKIEEPLPTRRLIGTSLMRPSVCRSCARRALLLLVIPFSHCCMTSSRRVTKHNTVPSRNQENQNFSLYMHVFINLLVMLINLQYLIIYKTVILNNNTT